LSREAKAKEAPSDGEVEFSFAGVNRAGART
jgi:hypothetical protein